MTRKDRGTQFRAARMELADKQATKTRRIEERGATHTLQLKLSAKDIGVSPDRSARSVRRNLERLKRQGKL